MLKFQAQLITHLLIFISLSLQANELKVVSWNMEWLTVNPDNKIYEGKRTPDDFVALTSYFNKLNADVIGLQELDSIAAFKRISSAQYNIVLSDRSKPQFSTNQYTSINQYTGFAIHQSVPFSDPQDVDFYRQAGHKLRFASYVILYPDSDTPIHLLSVHLKAGCMTKFNSNKTECQKLLTQGKNLNQWVIEREQQNQQYVIMGDFNHNLSYSGDWLWEVFTGELRTPPKLATKTTEPLCKVRKRNNAKYLHQFRSLIDHIIVSSGLYASDAVQTVYNERDALTYHLSDHCPVYTQLSW